MDNVCAFTDDAKLLAVVDSMGALAIWDTSTSALKQKYSPNFQFMGQCTSLHWLCNTISAKKKNEDSKGLFLALGTSKGQVHLYSYAEGHIHKQLIGDGHTGRVSGITNDADGSTLYSCGVDGQIIGWSLKELKQTMNWSIGSQKPHSILYVHSLAAIVVGSRQLKVYSIDAHRLIQCCNGHASEINLMLLVEFSSKNNYVVSTSKSDRIACVWRLGRNTEYKSVVCTLLMDDTAVFLSCSKNKEKDGFKLISVTRNGAMHIYNLNVDKITSSEGPIKPQLTVSIAPNNANTGNLRSIRILAATVLPYSSSLNVMLAYGREQCMVFEDLQPDFDKPLQILLRADPKHLVKQEAQRKTNLANELKSKTLDPIIIEDDVDYKSSSSMGVRTLEPINLDDMPIESRICNLSSKGEPTQGDKEKSKIYGQSRVQLLIQALQSKDKKLLDTALSAKESKAVQVTIENLPLPYIEPLAQELVRRMQEKHVNIGGVLKWMKPLLQTHFSHFLSWGSDELFSTFAPCLGLIEQRSQCISDLMKIKGRLNFLVDLIKDNARYREPKNACPAVIEITDSDNSEFEDATEKNLSEVNLVADSDDEVLVQDEEGEKIQMEKNCEESEAE